MDNQPATAGYILTNKIHQVNEWQIEVVTAQSIIGVIHAKTPDGTVSLAVNREDAVVLALKLQSLADGSFDSGQRLA